MPTESITARMAVASPESALGEFMFMPAGEHVIHATKGNKSVEVRVAIDRDTAATMEKQLRAVEARSAHRPFFDFNHDDNQASFWPVQFLWQDAPSPGVYARGEWSKAGQEAIEGKMYRTFSPVFHVDDDKAKPARVVANANARLNFGGLVNDPAFQKNLPIWAKQAGASPVTNTNPSHQPMTPEQIAALRAKIAQSQQEINALQPQAPGNAEIAEQLLAKQVELDADKAALETGELKARTAQLELEVTSQRTRDAKAAIKAATSRGAIPVKDLALQAKWEKMCIEDPENIGLLNQMRGSAALDAPITAGRRLTMNYGGGITVSRESTRDVLKGMEAIMARNRSLGLQDYAHKKEPAAEFGEIYAREIKPRLKEGDDIPLKGVNSLGTLAQTLVATRTLELLRLSLPLLSRISTNFSDQIVSYGDTLKTRFIGIPSVVSYNTTTGWAGSAMTTTDVSMTYNNFRGVQIILTAQEIAGTVRNLIEEIAPAQAYALGKDICDSLYAVITAANFITGITNIQGTARTAIQSGLGNFGRSTLIDMGGALDDAGVPNEGRFCILSRPYWSALKKDATIISLAAYQQAPIITKGMLPDIEDFDIIKGVNLPATAITGAGALQGFAGGKSALCLATRLSADYHSAIANPGNGTIQVVTLPDTGISANLVQYVDNTLGTANQRLELIYATAAGQPNAGQILTDV